MPDTWNPETYWDRFRTWQEKADALPPGQERDICMVIAEGYSHLALLIEKSTTNGMALPSNFKGSDVNAAS